MRPNASTRKHSCAERVETIGERRRLHLLEIDDLADQNGAPDMRDDQCHETFLRSHRQTPSLRRRITWKSEQLVADFSRMLNMVVHHLLWSHPLDGESRSAQVTPWNDLDELMDLLYIEEDRAPETWD